MHIYHSSALTLLPEAVIYGMLGTQKRSRHTHL